MIPISPNTNLFNSKGLRLLLKETNIKIKLDNKTIEEIKDNIPQNLL